MRSGRKKLLLRHWNLLKKDSISVKDYIRTETIFMKVINPFEGMGGWWCSTRQDVAKAKVKKKARGMKAKREGKQIEEKGFAVFFGGIKSWVVKSGKPIFWWCLQKGFWSRHNNLALKCQVLLHREVAFKQLKMPYIFWAYLLPVWMCAQYLGELIHCAKLCDCFSPGAEMAFICDFCKFLWNW